MLIGLRLISRAMVRQGMSNMGAPKGIINVVRIPGRRMFATQESLPRLPVPALQQTMDKYLKTVRPIVTDEEYAVTEEICKDFAKPGGTGEKLQKLLEERREKYINWLSEWWLNTAYLNYREPCPIYVNPGIIFPVQNFRDQTNQLRFAAKMIAGVLDYKIMVDEQTLPVEHMGDKPLCMIQFYQLLSACRIPGKKIDSIVTYPPDGPDPPRHIVVAHNNWFFAVDVYGKHGKPLNVEQLYQQLTKIVQMSRHPGLPIGIFTTEHRNTWGKLYSRLRKDKTNQASLEEISRSIFLLCLDQPMPHEKPEDRMTLIAHQMNNGGGSTYNTGNRWFDKTLQFIVGSDGSCGLNYEHSAAEGPPIISIADHTLTYAQRKTEKRPPAAGVTEPRKLRFNITPDIEKAMEAAKEHVDAAASDLDMYALPFTGYGKNFAKSQKVSPDALIQVSFQLAFYRLYQENPATYESGSLRLFQEGRTDTIRSCSIDTSNFVKAMDDIHTAPKDKVDLLKKAILAHRKYTSEAIQGQGIDRHLLGLKLIALENGMNVPELFMDASYQASSYFRLSTSQVASKHDALLCFGPTAPDGYGICYNPMPEQINMCVSAWNTSPKTNAKRMAESISRSLMDIHDLFTKTQQSKL